jgi:hypothetical protein
MPLSAPAKLALFRLILVAIPLSVAAAAAAWYGHVVTRPFLTLDVRQSGDNDLAFDREIGFVRPPHATTRRTQTGVDYTIHTDRLGARVNAPGAETPERVALMTVGCSFSEGHGMENEATYTERLGRIFHVPVANFAVGSYSGVQSLLSLRRHAGLAPKVVVYGLIEDHLRRDLDPCAPSFFPVCLEVPIVRGFERGAPAIAQVQATSLAGVELSDELMKLRDHPTVLARTVLGLRAAWHDYRDWRNPAVASAQAQMTDANRLRAEQFVLQQMARDTRAIGATLVVLYMGRLDGLPADDPSRGWRPLPPGFAASLPAGVVFVDATRAVARHYAEHPDQPLTLTAADDHPNAAAHQLFAQLLARAIREHGLLADARATPEAHP